MEHSPQRDRHHVILLGLPQDGPPATGDPNHQGSNSSPTASPEPGYQVHSAQPGPCPLQRFSASRAELVTVTLGAEVRSARPLPSPGWTVSKPSREQPGHAQGRAPSVTPAAVRQPCLSDEMMCRRHLLATSY